MAFQKNPLNFKNAVKIYARARFHTFYELKKRGKYIECNSS